MIYFDNASTTKVNSKILDEFTTLSQKYFANPSGSHKLAREANSLQDNAREKILNLLHFPNGKLIFTSSGTEANNLFILGAFEKYKNRGKEIIVSSYEHPSVINAVEYLKQNHGAKVKYLPLNGNGTISLKHLKEALTNETIIVSIMNINNEIGSVNNLKAIKEIIKDYPKIIFHSDLTQAVGKITPEVDFLDAFTFSAHKINGLKGSGALIINKKITLTPLLYGGLQEYKMRAGTSNFITNVLLATTLEQALLSERENFNAVTKLNTLLVKLLCQRSDLFRVNSPANNPYIINISLLTRKASIVLNALENEEIYIGTTSSCSAKLDEPSRSVFALTNDLELAKNSLRISFSAANTIEEVEYFYNRLLFLIEERNYGK